MKKIRLYNRDGADMFLVSNDENWWKFEIDKKHEYCLEYMRIGYGEENKSIYMVDPSGGPYLEVGNRIGNNMEYTIDTIIVKNDEIMIHTIKAKNDGMIYTIK